MAEIRVLDKHTAELIAAGEVVERPASVAKELLENAIDAGATQITLSIERGGIAQLQITDNGSGIEAEFIDKAFVRHATSKIAAAEDLAHIHTLGFRGEALASIASVARVDVLTKTEADEFACHYQIEGGEPKGVEPGARPVGTTITVRDLFFNTPARMKFLKKDASEGTFVGETVLHAALSHPEISFRFLKDGKQQFVTPGDGSLKSAAYAVLGREFSRDLLPVAGGTEHYGVTGLITPPRACRASRSAQHFYVNGRYVKNRTMMAALENAYKGTMMQGKFPGAILMLEMPAELVDVNVHPAKTEIRFAKESDVFDAVYRAVRTALAAPGSGECRFEIGRLAPEQEQRGTGELPLHQTVIPSEPVSLQKPGRRFASMSAAEFRAASAKQEEPQNRTAPQTGKMIPEDFAELHSESAVYEAAPRRTVRSGPTDFPPENTPQSIPKLNGAANSPDAVLHSASDALLDLLPELSDEVRETAGTAAFVKEMPGQNGPAPDSEQTALSALPSPEQTSLEPQASDSLRLVGEVFRTYIITERGNELCLIDKHAAHERILFEKLAGSYGNVPAQLLLVPVQVNLSAAEKQAVLQNLSLLEDVGIEADDFGWPTIVVRAVPADVEVEDVEDMLVELASRFMDGGRDALRERTEWVLHSVACRAAVKAGDRTTNAEMLALARKILDGEVPPFCPHGRPCVLKITRKELEKQFGRLV